MKIRFGARLARDPLRPACALARMVTGCVSACDAKLHRLMCYVNSSLHLKMVGWVGDDIKNLNPHILAGAGIAGDKKDSKRTCVVLLGIFGPDTRMPLTAVYKKQYAVSHSTPEAEIVAADLALRTLGLPALELWVIILQLDAELYFHKDNQAMIAVMLSGRNPAMRHLGRTHRVSVTGYMRGSSLTRVSS